MFKRNLFVIGVIALFLLSGCQVYEDIYGESDVSTISMEDIIVEGEDIEEDIVEEMEEIEEEEKGLLDIFKDAETEEEEIDEVIEIIEEEIVEEIEVLLDTLD